MDHPCDKCGKPATIYLTEITDGHKVEKHLCEECAVAEGVAIKAEGPISKLLEDFILQSSDEPGEPQPTCDVCGMSFNEFVDKKLLGCPHDYDVFSKQLKPILNSEHENATQHIGKVPHRAGSDQKKQNAILRLRSQLRTAIAAEEYERAAALRDQIKELEKT